MAILFFRQNELEQKLDFFKDFRLNHKKKIYTWLALSGLLLGSLCVLLARAHTSMRAEYVRLCVTEKVSQERLLTAQKQAKGLFAQKKLHEALQKRLKGLEVKRGRTEKLLALLGALGKMIPEQVWLEQISYGDKGQVVLKGVALDGEQVAIFHENLEQATLLTHCLLEVLALEKGRNHFHLKALF